MLHFVEAFENATSCCNMFWKKWHKLKTVTLRCNIMKKMAKKCFKNKIQKIQYKNIVCLLLACVEFKKCKLFILKVQIFIISSQNNVSSYNYYIRLPKVVNIWYFFYQMLQNHVTIEMLHHNVI